MWVFCLTPFTDTFYEDFFIPFTNTLLRNILVSKGFLGIFFPPACVEVGLLHLNLWRKWCLKLSEAFGAALCSCLICLCREKRSDLFLEPVVLGLLHKHCLAGKDGISLQGLTGWFAGWGILGNPAKGEREVKGMMQLRRCEFLDFAGGEFK